MFFNTRKVGRSPIQLWHPFCIHVLPYCWFVVLRPVDWKKPGSPMTASRNSALARLVFLLCFIPPLQTQRQGTAFISLVLQLHTPFCPISHNPPLPLWLSSSYLLPHYSCLSHPPPLSLSPTHSLSLLVFCATYTHDPKPPLNNKQEEENVFKARTISGINENCSRCLSSKAEQENVTSGCLTVHFMIRTYRKLFLSIYRI